MAFLFLAPTGTLEEKIIALSQYGDILDTLLEDSNTDRARSQIICTILLDSAARFTREIPNDQMNRIVWQAFHKFYNSLTQVLVKFSSDPVIHQSHFQPLLDEISRRIGTAPR